MRPHIQRTDRPLFVSATVAVLAWGALAFGAEYAWAYTPLLVMCLTLGVLGVLTASGDGTRQRSVGLALLGILVAGSLQLVPLPEPILSTLSPTRMERDYQELYASAFPRPARADLSDAEPGPRRPLSVHPARTMLGLAFLAALSCFLYGCARALGVVRPSGIVRGLIALGVVVALVNIAQEASDSALVYGFWHPRKAEPPSAPFVNGNHVAGWLVMTLSLTLGYLCGVVARHRSGPDWRSRVLSLASRQANEVMVTGVAVLVMAVSLVLTMSRSGIMSLVLALIVSSVWAARRQPGLSRRLLVPVTVGLLFVVAVGLGGGVAAVEQEFSSASWSDLEGRVGIWRDTVTIIRDFPLTGTGLNTYGVSMLGYQTYNPSVRWVEAHNDYLQLVAEGGILLAVPVAIAFFVLVRETRRRFQEGDDDEMTYWLRAGAVTGLIALGLQSLVDFSVQMPGNAVLFATLWAIALHRCGGQRRSRRA